MRRVPLFARRAVVDFVETFLPSILVLNFLSPGDALVPALVTAAAAAGMSAVRRNWNLFSRWLRDTAQYDEVPPAGGGIA